MKTTPHSADPKKQPTDPRQDPKTRGTTITASPPTEPQPADAEDEETPADPAAASVQPDTSGDTDPGASNTGGVHPL